MAFLNLKKLVATSYDFQNCSFLCKNIVYGFGFGFMFLSSLFFLFVRFSNVSSFSRYEIVKKVVVVDRNHVTSSQNLRNSSSSFQKCDIFNGRWVRDDTKPYYPPESCPYVDGIFNCHHHKRPDAEFVKWRWQPFECDIPSLNTTDFLERLKGKKMVFVGDSLKRNMWESLVCILQHSLKNKSMAYEISGEYNCTIGYVKAPFLAMESSLNGRKHLRLDMMDSSTTSFYHDANILIFNTGHWWNLDKTSQGSKDFYQEGNHVYPRLELLDAYARALSTWATWVDSNINTQTTQVIFVGDTATHYSGGQWNSGGQCRNETKPIFNTSPLTNYPPKMRAFDTVLRVMKTPVIYLNISKLTDYRKDGHPSIYRTWGKSKKRQVAAQRLQDCRHWCLPGVPDTWNELLYASLLKAGI